MFKPENVPEAAWKATGLPEADARTVIAAAINAWPGAWINAGNGSWTRWLELTLPGDKEQ